MIVGTAGHIDHGKSSLVRAITGVDPDRLKEEKARGITIDLGFAYWPQPDGSAIGFVDVPGHERFVHTMLAGATGIDLVLLVVAADDGVMPQTREHLAIMDLLGLRRGVVALTKVDLVDAARLATVRAEVEAALHGTALAGSPIAPVSTVTGEGLPELEALLAAEANVTTLRREAGLFRLLVDRCFTLSGAGTVVTGSVVAGSVAVGDEVVVSPSGLTARVRFIHAQNRPAERGRAGDRCALNLAGPGVAKDAIRRGDVVMDPRLHAPTQRLDAELRVLPTEPKGVGLWMPVWLHLGSAEVAARVVPLGDGAIRPGQTGRVQLVLDSPIAAVAHDRFVIRDTSATRTIGGGRVLDLRAPERRRRTPERLAQLDALAHPRVEDALAALVRTAPFHVPLGAFARDHGLAPTDLVRIADAQALIRVPVGDDAVAMDPAIWLALKQNMLAALAAWHESNPDLVGVGLERLRLQLEPRLPAPLFRAILQALARPPASAPEIALQGAWVRLAGHEVRLSPEDEALWARIRPLIEGEERFRPPRVRDIASLLDVEEPRIRRTFKLTGRRGEVDEVAHDHFFLRSTVAEMIAIATQLAAGAPKGEFTAAQFRDRLDNGRKVAIQILEFFDRHGVTMRRGDLRRINRHRLDLFGAAA
ncbi:selenocysteine-specific translation factor [Alsobacter metallidurans]|uniref:Selenocysteine-specific elongation factor n=1 Tax=Alsobacter metallidurans TaxID=340221 RepID=A0A917I336_9HYPH|nr:selenocysteine-specific translation elongation factor [Alsobacter metallidurans]GGH07780.1 selenocysteine-specific translation factor [Alsobacter metallidurans]